ncbi:MAG: hypothetical protein IIB22_02185 [Chloroflexi bacterium]|nr:hypothetical protein [Chloroflexota bacterium]
MTRLLLASVAFVAAFAILVTSAPQVFGCAFSVSPTTYEPPISRSAHLTGLEMAGYNMIAPSNVFFGIPNVETGLRGERAFDEDPYVPPTLLKAIGYIESGIRQSQSGTFGGVEAVLESFDCGYGIMQITSGMTSPLDDGWPSLQQALVATHYLYDIGRGAAILVEKWNGAPEVRPIAGTDSVSHPRIVENWYFATWSYNGFTGPFAAIRSNHPASPSYAWPRSGFSCGALDDGYGHSYGDYPYQELVFGCAARPPSVSGEQLWDPLALSLPDTEDPLWGEPLSLETWTACTSGDSELACANWDLMDMPSPAPAHFDPVERPSDEAAEGAHGDPVLSVSHTSVDELATTVTITNIGQGILAWRADHEQEWFAIDKQAGVALGSDVICTLGVPCERDATLRITIAPNLAPTDGSFGWVNIISLTTGQLWQVGVTPPPVTAEPTNTPRPTFTPTAVPTPPPAVIVGDVNCNRTANSVDATLILQFGAGLISALLCPEGGDVNLDGRINVLDATLILQFEGGLIDRLPPP